MKSQVEGVSAAFDEFKRMVTDLYRNDGMVNDAETGKITDRAVCLVKNLPAQSRVDFLRQVDAFLREDAMAPYDKPSMLDILEDWQIRRALVAAVFREDVSSAVFHDAANAASRFCALVTWHFRDDDELSQEDMGKITRAAQSAVRALTPSDRLVFLDAVQNFLAATDDTLAIPEYQKEEIRVAITDVVYPATPACETAEPCLPQS